jgi:SAM-dependent methyltransferase
LPDTPEVVSDYLEDVGLVDGMPQRAFCRSLESRFGAVGRAFTNVPDSAPPRQLYCAKNADLDLSLAISSQGWAHCNEVYLSWFVQREWGSPGSIIDIGCDNGIQTCAYARLYPQAQIVGIDILPQSVECATQLAARLNLPNVEFHCADALNLPQHLADRTFDLVTSARVVWDIAHQEDKSFRTIEAALSQPPDSGLAAYAQTLADLLAENGRLVSFEHHTDPAKLAEWWRVLYDVGIGIRWDEAAFVTIQRWGLWGTESTYFDPVLVASKPADETLKPDELRRWWARSHPEIEAAVPFKRLRGSEAEAVFQALNPSELVKGLQFKAEDMPYHTEFWRLGPLILRYTYSCAQCDTSSTRELLVLFQHVTENLILALEAELAERGVREIREYNSPEDVDDGPPSPDSHDEGQTGKNHAA